MHSINHWLEKLAADNICEMPDNKSEDETPWYISALMGLFGWLASLFLLGFIGVALDFIVDSGMASTIVGLTLLAGAFLLQKQMPSDFLSQFSLAISIAGQALLGVSLFLHLDIASQLQWTLYALAQLCIALVMPNRINRFLSALFFMICIAIALNESEVASLFMPFMMLAVAYLWLNEFTLTPKLRASRAIIYGLTIGLAAMKISAGYLNFDSDNDLIVSSGLSLWLDEGLSVVVLLYVLYQLTKKADTNIHNAVNASHLVLLLVICVLTFFANGLAMSLMFLLLAFASRNHFLLSIGVVSALFNLSAYYYWLEISLMHKSMMLMGVGAACLSLFYWSKQTTTSLLKGLNHD